jgi:hypothetical protein
MTGLSPAGRAPRDPIATSIEQARPQQRADVHGLITAAASMAISGVPACRYTLADGTGELDLLFLGRVAIRGLAPGGWLRAAGRVAVRDGRPVLWNPRYRLDLPASGTAGGEPEHSEREDGDRERHDGERHDGERRDAAALIRPLAGTGAPGRPSAGDLVAGGAGPYRAS